MEKSLKHFVRRILGIHLLLLALLLAVVTLAARHVYKTSRNEALRQARARQTLLATQTARGITGFYNSILSDLNLLKPEDEDASDLPDSSDQPMPDARPLVNFSMVRQAVSQMLAMQLRNRAHLFLVDEALHSHPLGSQDRPGKMLAGGKLNKAAFAPAPPATGQSPEFEQMLADHFGAFLKSLSAPAISDLQIMQGKGATRAIKLVAVPLFSNPRPLYSGHIPSAPRRTGWLVAAVSAHNIEQEFLTTLDRDNDGDRINDVSGAFLVDESMKVMAADRHELLGASLGISTAPTLFKVVDSIRNSAVDSGPTDTLNTPFRIGTDNFEPAMVSVSPVEVMGKHWFLLIISPLKGVDAVVWDLSRQALAWAVFVALSMTGILVSTAAQLIFSRMRMERVRHQTLQNEMRQARQIQLAWLPPKTKTTCGQQLLDIASLNRPATHISGDFYNFFELPDGRTAVVIGDVTGHGTAAAFLMATAQLLVRNTLPQYCDPGQCMEVVNKQLANQMFNGQFVTMQILVIDPRAGEVLIATVGHPAPLYSHNGSFEQAIIEPQLVAGVDPNMTYPTERFELAPGASLLLYTDGVIETANAAGERLRLDGLRDGLHGQITSAEDLLQRAVSIVNTFRHGEDLHDDLTLVALHFLTRSPHDLPPRSSPAPEPHPEPMESVVM